MPSDEPSRGLDRILTIWSQRKCSAIPHVWVARLSCGGPRSSRPQPCGMTPRTRKSSHGRSVLALLEPHATRSSRTQSSAVIWMRGRRASPRSPTGIRHGASRRSGGVPSKSSQSRPQRCSSRRFATRAAVTAAYRSRQTPGSIADADALVEQAIHFSQLADEHHRQTSSHSRRHPGNRGSHLSRRQRQRDCLVHRGAGRRGSRSDRTGPGPAGGARTAGAGVRIRRDNHGRAVGRLAEAGCRARTDLAPARRLDWAGIAVLKRAYGSSASADTARGCWRRRSEAHCSGPSCSAETS